VVNTDDSMDRLLRRTTRPREDVRPHGDCLDAETLAAWTDGSLTALDRTAAETHAADCDRCLAVLAAIAKTSPPASTNQRPSWLSLRWLVPLTTATVAITAWVLIQPPGTPSPPAEPPTANVVTTPSAPTVQREADAKQRGERARAGSDAPERKVSPSAAPRSRDQAQLRRSDRSTAKNAPAATDSLAEQVQSRAAAPAPPAAPAAAARAEAQEKRADVFAGAAAQVAGVVVSPDPNIRWRIVARSVERSTDGGRTWRAQPTGTTVDLLAAAAPAPSVCWIVGRSGVVLRSTDGETWRRLPSPDPAADLVGVTARDALTAAVTTADGRRYNTTDGGGTWTLEKHP
jgi:hypothetical protein